MIGVDLRFVSHQSADVSQNSQKPERKKRRFGFNSFSPQCSSGVSRSGPCIELKENRDVLLLTLFLFFSFSLCEIFSYCTG